ncbi:MAG: hypothetical protein WA581_21730 [Candidatus Acidiferrales bacterium]
MRALLASFDLTMAGFRLLELLYREEIMTVPDVAQRRGAVRQTMDAIIARLVERGGVRRVLIALPPVDPAGIHLAKDMLPSHSKTSHPGDGRDELHLCCDRERACALAPGGEHEDRPGGFMRCGSQLCARHNSRIGPRQSRRVSRARVPVNSKIDEEPNGAVRLGHRLRRQSFRIVGAEG